MNKQIYIINGSGGVGKDTVCAIAAERYAVRNVSSITPIAQIAKFAGWDGRKTPEARRLLARLKEVFTEYNDLSFQYCLRQLAEFRGSPEQILFVHIREPEEIERFRTAAGGGCRTLLVRRPSVESRGPLGNHADDLVCTYPYDEVLINDSTVERLRTRVFALLERNFSQESI